MIMKSNIHNKQLCDNPWHTSTHLHYQIVRITKHSTIVHALVVCNCVAISCFLWLCVDIYNIHNITYTILPEHHIDNSPKMTLFALLNHWCSWIMIGFTCYNPGSKYMLLDHVRCSSEKGELCTFWSSDEHPEHPTRDVNSIQIIWNHSDKWRLHPTKI